MKFSVRMFRQMVLHVLYLEKGNGNVPYHLPEKRVVQVEKQMKRSIFSGTCNCGQMAQKFLGIILILILILLLYLYTVKSSV